MNLLRRHRTLVSIAVLTMTVLLLSAGSAWAATYYSQGSLDPNVTTNWNSIRLGGGSSPANFTSGDVFAIQASHSMATTAAWTVSGAGSKVQIESGGTLTANHIVAVPTFQVDDGGSYIHNAASGTSNGVASDLPGSTTRTFGSASTVEIRKWANGGTVPVALPNITSALNRSGDLSVTGSGTMTESGNKKPAVTFQKAGTQVFTAGGTVSGAPDFTVNGGSTLDLGTNILTGGSFTLSAGAGLIV